MDAYGQVNGGAEGDRTLDLRIANATLSQLSYRPTCSRRDRSQHGRTPKRARDSSTRTRDGKSHNRYHAQAALSAGNSRGLQDAQSWEPRSGLHGPQPERQADDVADLLKNGSLILSSTRRFHPRVTREACSARRLLAAGRGQDHGGRRESAVTAKSRRLRSQVRAALHPALRSDKAVARAYDVVGPLGMACASKLRSTLQVSLRMRYWRICASVAMRRFSARRLQRKFANAAPVHRSVVAGPGARNTAAPESAPAIAPTTMGADAARKSWRMGRCILISVRPRADPRWRRIVRRPMPNRPHWSEMRRIQQSCGRVVAKLRAQDRKSRQWPTVVQAPRRPCRRHLLRQSRRGATKSTAITTKPNRSSSTLIRSPPTVPPTWYRLAARAAFSGADPALLNSSGIQEFRK